MIGKSRGFFLFLLGILVLGFPLPVKASSVVPLLDQADKLDTQATFRDQVLELKAIYLQNKAMLQLLEQILQEQKKTKQILLEQKGDS